MSEGILAVVLAGGQSRRMDGHEKSFVQLAGRPLLDHVLDRLRPQTAEIVINANGEAGRFQRWDLPVIRDVIAGGLGPLVGLLSALEWAAANRPGIRDVLSVAADMPFLPHDLVGRLAKGRAGAALPAAVGSNNGRLHPLVGLWPVRDAAALRQAIVERGLAKATLWATRPSVAIVPFVTEGADPFFNVNTPGDLSAATEALASGVHYGASPSSR